ncbi:MAG TPA: hypothetical protein PKI14_04800 [Fervidobacterium sp.]|nr:hypothetical protein [Fervidobacterium sp.]HPT54110.1 hypothetical protein [Fervidobacterium sp.]HPZ17511.1 hypothetical protein [Fervidobacterium sp.]HQE48453.1 hypothetical protein [Fervidobacterium sp.]HUM42248.1 hypothetical protein [Fervidobacterium sp.]
MKEVLGEHAMEKFMMLKEHEWWGYFTNATEWERRRYENI